MIRTRRDRNRRLQHLARFWAILATAGVLMVAAGADAPLKNRAKTKTPLPPLNEKVVGFAWEHVGKKVDNGQCTSLAVEALRFAGARRFPFDRTDGDYVWGRPVDSFREALPGDVLQFRDAVFQGKSMLSKRRWMTWRHEYHHHTAILAEVRDGGRQVTILHQNFGPDGAPDAEKKVVQEATLRPDSLQKGGKVWIYRPVAPDEPEPPRSKPAPDHEPRASTEPETPS